MRGAQSYERLEEGPVILLRIESADMTDEQRVLRNPAGTSEREAGLCVPGEFYGIDPIPDDTIQRRIETDLLCVFEAPTRIGNQGIYGKSP